MTNATGSDDVTLEELETALKVVAYCLLRIGPVVTPILERLEREVERARRDDPRERARRILESYTDRGGRKAIPLSTSALTSSE